MSGLFQNRVSGKKVVIKGFTKTKKYGTTMVQMVQVGTGLEFKLSLSRFNAAYTLAA